MKFLVVFELKDLDSGASGFLMTIKGFLNNFQDLDQYLDDILKATSFVLTKVPKKNEKEGIVLQLKKLLG